MEEQKKGFIVWVKAHKKELVFAGISVTALIGIILCIEKRDSIESLWKPLSRAMEKSPAEAVEVSHTTIDKITRSSFTATDVITQNEIQSINTTKDFRNPFDISDHIRNLHEGWRASTEKIIEAEAMGIILQPGQTFVDAYTKGGVQA
jgi:hypothetical protein